MRTTTFMAVAAGVTVFGYLAFRVVDLEARVAALTRQLGALPEADTATPAQPATPTTAPVPTQGLQQRIAKVEKDLDSLRASVARLDKVVGRENHALDDKDILSVVERENNRIKDVQLEWSRARWGEGRDAALATFSRTYGLTPDQTTRLQQAIHKELDSMVELMQRPELVADPDQAAADLQKVLDNTDNEVKRMLNPAQQAAWAQGRSFERRWFWPWLPNNLNK